MQQEVILHPASIIAELKKNKVTHVVWLPDSETNFMYQQLTADPDVDLVPVCREGGDHGHRRRPLGRRKAACGFNPEYRYI